MRKLLLTLVALGLPTGALAVPIPGYNTFEIPCTGIYDRQIDPIVEPGVAQSAHMHTFYGFMILWKDINAKALGDAAQTVNIAKHIQTIPGGADSGIRDPGYVPQITSCNLYGDWAGYWIPAPLVDGISYSPADRNWTWSDTATYPRAVSILRNTWAGQIGKHTYEIPFGATMVVGDPHTPNEAAMSPHVWYNCGEDLMQTRSKKPYNCEGGPTPPPVDPVPALYMTYQTMYNAVVAQNANVDTAKASGNKMLLVAALNDLLPKLDQLKMAATALRDGAAALPPPPSPGGTPPRDEWAYTGVVTAVIEYPDCWDGQNAYPNLDVQAGIGRNHFYYSTGGSCGNGALITKLVSQYHFWDPAAGHVMTNPLNPDGSVRLSFSSGPYYTLHADFWNDWDISLGGITAGCLNKEATYGTAANPPVANWPIQLGATGALACNDGATQFPRCPAPSPPPYDVWYSPSGVLPCKDQD